MRKNPFAVGFIGALPFALIATLISAKLHFFIFVWLIYVIFSSIGAFYGTSYIRKDSSSEDFLKILFWSNTVSWIIAPLGFFTASATEIINHRNKGEDHNFFKNLSRFCFIASIVSLSLIFGLLLNA